MIKLGKCLPAFSSHSMQSALIVPESTQERRPEYLAEDSSCQEEAGGGEEKAR